MPTRSETPSFEPLGPEVERSDEVGDANDTGWLVRRVYVVLGAFSACVGVLLTVLWARVLLEIAIVIFNIATTLSEIDHKLTPASSDS